MRILLPFRCVGTYVLASAVLASTLSILVAPAAKAAVPITTYPATKVRNIIETKNIASATHSAGTITFTTTTKNLFAFSPTATAHSQFVRITGMINNPATCSMTSANVSYGILTDGFNGKVDGLNITSISTSGGIVTYNVSGSIGSVQPQEQVTILNATTAGFNGTFTVNSVTASSFTVISAVTGASSTAFGKHYIWDRITGATDYTFTVARNPDGVGACTATTNIGSLAATRDGDNLPSVRTSNMATDGTGATIFMATGSRWPSTQNAEGLLYISRNSGATFSRVDLVGPDDVSLGNTPITNPKTTPGYNDLYGCQHRTCQWSSVSMSANGLVLAATSAAGAFIYSTDGGYHWIEVMREKYFRCQNDGSGHPWQQVSVSKGGNKIVAATQSGIVFVLDLTQSNNLTLTPVFPTGASGCVQTPYLTNTNPAVYSNSAIDLASVPAELKTGGSIYAFGIDQFGSRIVISYGKNRVTACNISGTSISSCANAPNVTWDNATAPLAWSASGMDVSSVYVSNSGQYVTIGTFSNLIMRSEDYGRSFQMSGSVYAFGNGGSSTNVSDCNDPNGIISISGSANGQVQVFVTQNNNSGSKLANYMVPGVCKSTNYGRKNSWSPVQVSMYAGDATDISRKQVWTSVVLGTTGSPMYLGSSGVSQANVSTSQTTLTPCGSTYVLYCSPYFWSNFGVTGPDTLATPFGTSISGQFYSTVNPPSGAAATISWALGRTSNGSAVSGITISSNGTLQVSSSMPVGSYEMRITGTDNGTSAYIDMFIYVYNPSRPPPTFDTPVSTSDGYTVNITNYDPEYNYSALSDTGTVTVGTASGSTLPLTVTGIAPSSPAIITASSFMGTVVTTQYSILTSTVTGYSTGPQTALVITSDPTVAVRGSRTLTTSGGSGLGSVSYAVTTAGDAGCSIVGAVLSVTSTTVGQTCGVTATKAANGSFLSVSSDEQTITVKNAGLVPIFDTPIRTATGFTVRITNYSASYTWSITTSAGSISVSAPSGSTETITVSSLTDGASATVSASTSRNEYSTETSTVTSSALKAITIQASSPTFIRGSTITETFTVTTLIGSDTITSVTFTFTGTSPTSYGPSTSAPSAIGTYQAMPSAAVFGVGTSSNYIITYLPGVLTIITDPDLGDGELVITVSPFAKATFVTITVRTAYAGRVGLKANNRKIAGCTSILTVNFVATCRWRPSTHGSILLVGTLTPTDVSITPSTYSLRTVATRRTTARS